MNIIRSFTGSVMEVTMSRIRILLAGSAVTLALAGCMHNGYQTASGDVAVDSLSASRTAILRVQNAYSSEVRVYTIIDGKANYVAKAMPGESRTVVLDPNLFPARSISFEARPADGTTAGKVGPYTVEKGETVEIVVPAAVSEIRATVHRSTR
jgi:hypothetical protein